EVCAAGAADDIQQFSAQTHWTSESAADGTLTPALSPPKGEGARREAEEEPGIAVVARRQNHKEVSRKVNPIVLRAFATNPPVTMRNVAKGYGELLVGAHKAWRELLKKAEEDKAPMPAVLPDGA